MTRYTELRHAGYYQPDLTDQERQAIADQVDGTDTRSEAPKGSTTSSDTRPAAKTTRTTRKTK